MKDEQVTLLRYGRTNTYFVKGTRGGLLVDTDMADTLPAFYRALGDAGLRLTDISYVMATHYHPDHCGLIGRLQEMGIPLLLFEEQTEEAGFSDAVYARMPHTDYRPVRPESARILPCGGSREALAELGISGEVLPVPSHSPGSVCLLLDSGICLAGDLEPMEYRDAYGEEEGALLRADWEKILSRGAKRICYAHVNEKVL